jgi:hypothetical protein
MRAGYMCYICGENYRVADRRDFPAGSDTEAIAIAIAFSSEYSPNTFQLWEGLRLVHQAKTPLGAPRA